MNPLSKKLSKKLFHQHLEQHNKLYTDNIIIDCRNLDSKIKDREVFAFCREVFRKPFYFDHADEDAFKVKNYKYIINRHKKKYLYMYRVLSFPGDSFYIDINILIPDNNEIKAALDTDLKFDPEKI